MAQGAQGGAAHRGASNGGESLGKDQLHKCQQLQQQQVAGSEPHRTSHEGWNVDEHIEVQQLPGSFEQQEAVCVQQQHQQAEGGQQQQQAVDPTNDFMQVMQHQPVVLPVPSGMQAEWLQRSVFLRMMSGTSRETLARK